MYWSRFCLTLIHFHFQVEACKSAMDWRALASDILTAERRSQGTRQSAKLYTSSNIYIYIVKCICIQSWINTRYWLKNIVSIGRPSIYGDKLQELKDIIRKKSGPRPPPQKASSSHHSLQSSAFFVAASLVVRSLKFKGFCKSHLMLDPIAGQSKSSEIKSGEEDQKSTAAEPKDPFVQCLFLGLFQLHVSWHQSWFKSFATLQRKRQGKHERRLSRSVFNWFRHPAGLCHANIVWPGRGETGWKHECQKVMRRPDTLDQTPRVTKLRTSNNQNRLPLWGSGPTCRDTWRQGAERVLEEILHKQAVPCTAPGPVSSFASPETYETTADAFWKLSHQDHTPRPSQAVETNTHICVCHQKSRGKGGFRLQQL